MNLEEIKTYAHKIKTLKVINKNKQSLYSHVVIKINVPSNDDEVIRFSLEPNDQFISHQHYLENKNIMTSTDDYYVFIPNNLDSITTLYVHYFPADLYSYDNELTSLVQAYDFSNLTADQITSNRYTKKLDKEKRLTVQSSDSKSVTKKHDPNYKNYITTNNANQTQKGYFPLSSKYRTNKNWEVPDLSDFNPEWASNTNAPYWEARLPFEDMESPINVYLNYEYLQTSREYHQHYYGFEGEETECKTMNVLEGTNINKLDNKFKSKNNYRLINWGNPYSDKHSIYVPHENIIPINLATMNIHLANDETQETCSWKKNNCKNYYVYTPKIFDNAGNERGFCSQDVTLTEGKNYSLQYYIYIPSQARVDDDSCYIELETESKVYTMDNAFIQKDKELRNQWIYHEVPFTAGSSNTINIVGPQSFNPETDINNEIFFIHIQIVEMVEYSPTLQYGGTGIHIVEQDETTFKSISEMICDNQPITPDNKPWTPIEIDLPTPVSDVNITIENENYAYYDQYTTNLYYDHLSTVTSEKRILKYEPSTQNVKGDPQVFSYNTETTDLIATYTDFLKGVYGPDNTFTFYFTDTYGNLVKDGKVEIGIFKTRDKNAALSAAEAIVTRTPREIKTGIEVFKNVDLSNLPTNITKYYVRLVYTNPCFSQPKVVFKPLHMYKENLHIDAIRINDVDFTASKYTIKNIQQFPLKIEAHIVNQYSGEQSIGYMELSLNDVLNQSTIIDQDGWVDFYLEVEDLIEGCQTVKIEYYREYFKSLAFIYFDICVTSLNDLKAYIPVTVKQYTINGKLKALTDNKLIVDRDECVLFVMNTGNHSKFRLEVNKSDGKNTEIIYKQNVYNQTSEDFVFIHEPCCDEDHKCSDGKGDPTCCHTKNYTYTIKTGNMQDENGVDIKDLYRDYEKSFNIEIDPDT